MGTAIPLILQIIVSAANAAQAASKGNATATEIEQATAALASIVESAAAAHQAITGQPLDLSKLQPMDPVQ